MSFSLRILPRAEKDAQHIFDYIADRHQREPCVGGMPYNKRQGR
jgi:plasmid stabilization system protein ParE